ncbi:poly polymerase catalytic domain-containing protein [Lentinula guzmanii]|uniref:Poly [ADP-ribose] polymerase n=1 Tax=Lentinula guzmanii TaxID=2804957 RepID=A0AA38MS82_9AGAR|nr:poly polymerase catalytic domain-containing protein [Lentinula guzmanii]
MPPRKKTADGAAPAAPTRSSSRTKAAKDAAAAATTTAATVAKPKSKTKRARTSSDDEDDAPPAKKPASKKAKKSKAAVDTKDEDIEMEDKPVNVKQVIKRGAAPVDEVSGKVSTHQVYANEEGVWDAMLNQTDINENKNKFYVLQLLHPISSNATCELFTHWGRVGERGQTQTKGPFPAAVAINEFKKQFKAKAGALWENRIGMEPKKGKYFFLERDYDDDGDEEDNAKPKSKGKGKSESEQIPIPDSTLKPEVQEFCRLIFNTSIIDATLSSMNYDANKLPLGKLSKATILKGFAALKALSEVIDNPNSEEAKKWGGQQAGCAELTNRYYSIIPHDFGRSKPPAIRTQDTLKRELELVDALGDMEIATELIQASTASDKEGNPVNPLDAQFNSLALNKMDPVARNSNEFKMLEKYMTDTHGKTHGHIKTKIRNVYRVERSTETEAWKKAGNDTLKNEERMLLWHGSRTTNFAGILSQGLRIAPPEAPVNGYMFGKGIYFADMMSKSAGYCYPHLSGGTGVLLLCEVAAQPFYERHDAEYNADVSCKKQGKRATKGIGLNAPTTWKDAGEALDNEELKGCIMPDGPSAEIPNPQGYLQYNEYIVYDVSQIRVKYLFMVEM